MIYTYNRFEQTNLNQKRERKNQKRESLFWTRNKKKTCWIAEYTLYSPPKVHHKSSSGIEYRLIRSSISPKQQQQQKKKQWKENEGMNERKILTSQSTRHCCCCCWGARFFSFLLLVKIELVNFFFLFSFLLKSYIFFLPFLKKKISFYRWKQKTGNILRIICMMVIIKVKKRKKNIHKLHTNIPLDDGQTQTFTNIVMMMMIINNQTNNQDILWPHKMLPIKKKIHSVVVFFLDWYDSIDFCSTWKQQKTTKIKNQDQYRSKNL